MKKIKAKFVKEIPCPVRGGRRSLYQTNGEHKYVIASAIPCPFDTMEPETLIFPADAEGNVIDWIDLEGSQRGTMDIERVMKKAFNVVDKL